MRKALFILYILSCTCNYLQAQLNLVPNHSFEELFDCPDNVDQLNKCKEWYNPTPNKGSPDYFNDCSINTVNVPNNVFGFQFASEGKAYVGIALWTENITPVNYDYREYIGVKLKNKLKANVKYCVSFDISLANKTHIAVKSIQLALTDTPLIISGAHNLSVFSPQLEFKSKIFFSDTLQWINLKKSFISKGGEEYITIGNFYKNNETDTMKLNSTIPNTLNASYYYIDNVWLYECEDDRLPPPPATPASDSSLHYKLPNVISPNADGLNDAFVLESRGVKEVSVTLYNRWGELVQNTKYKVQSVDMLSKTQLWDATHKNKPAPQGVYYYIIELSTKTGKVIIEKGTVTVL